MGTSALVVLAAGVSAVAASWIMWRATRTNAAWAMGAGIVLAFATIGCALVIAWLLTRAVYGH
jgi:hypothetical protein